MTPNAEEFISLWQRIYSSNFSEGKTSDEKLIKIMEELGELSQKHLILKKSSGTAYRNPIERHEYHEEMVDVYIMLMSIVCDELQSGLATEKEFLDILEQKISKWESVIQK